MPSATSAPASRRVTRRRRRSFARRAARSPSSATSPIRTAPRPTSGVASIRAGGRSRRGSGPRSGTTSTLRARRRAAIERFHLPRRGWYSYELGAWHVVVLNSNCDDVGGCGRLSPQWRWLRADLAAHPARCTLAYWHHPRFSSGPHGSSATHGAALEPARAGARRDRPRRARPRLRAVRPGRPGSARSSSAPAAPRCYPVLFPRSGSVVHDDATFGVLRLRLAPGGYAWRFLPAGRGTFTDAGSGTCG